MGHGQHLLQGVDEGPRRTPPTLSHPGPVSEDPTLPHKCFNLSVLHSLVLLNLVAPKHSLIRDQTHASCIESKGS